MTQSKLNKKLDKKLTKKLDKKLINKKTKTKKTSVGKSSILKSASKTKSVSQTKSKATPKVKDNLSAKAKSLSGNLAQEKENSAGLLSHIKSVVASHSSDPTQLLAILREVQAKWRHVSPAGCQCDMLKSSIFLAFTSKELQHFTIFSQEPTVVNIQST
jgi:hypothetical protein